MMAPLRSRMTEKGQVTIPAQIRDQMGLKPRDQVEFEIVNGTAVLRPVRSSILDFYLSVPPHEPPLSDRELRERFERGVADDVTTEMAREGAAHR